MDFELTTAEILRAFTEGLAGHDGRVSESYDDGARLFVRAVLPRAGDVARSDRVQAGVALRATAIQIDVHPYLFRLVCRNGQIVVEAAETRRIEVPAWAAPEMTLAEVRGAVDVCCGERAFTNAADAMRRARGESGAEFLITIMSMLHAIPNGSRVLPQILDQFARREEPTRFGLINAVTATARDTRNPEMKWRLESLGGELAVLEAPVPAMPRGVARRFAAV